MKANSNIVSLDETLRGAGQAAPESTQADVRAAHIPGLISSIQVLATQLFGQHTLQLFDQVDDAFFELAEKPTNVSEQNGYLDAMRELRLKREQAEHSFVERIANALAYQRDESGPLFFTALKNTSKPGSGNCETAGSESLSMLDDERMEEMLAINSMAKKIEAAHSDTLLLLDARFAHVAGVDASSRGVEKWVNPISAKIICGHFVDASACLKLDIKARIVVFKWFEKTMNHCFGQFYTRANQLMIEANILPELTRDTLHKPIAERSASNAGIAEATAVVSPAVNEPSVIDVFDTQRHQLVDFAGAQSTMALMNASNTPHYAPTLAGQIAMIPASDQPVINRQVLHGLWHGLQTHGLEQPYARSTTAAGGLPAVASPEGVVKGFLAALGRSQSQPSIATLDRDIIGLVSILFKFIIDDRVVAEPMKAAISRMQVPVIKAALDEASFFNDALHPARKLLNTMTEATVGWVPDDNWQTDGLYLAICSAVDFVVAEYDTDLNIFATAEETLKIFLQGESKRADIRKKRVVEVEQGRDQTAVIKNHIDTLIDGYLDKKTPEFIRQMLFGPWSQWLFIIYHRESEGSSTWQQAVEAVRELLWTVSDERCASNRHDILALLPDLITLLRKGLDAVGHDRQAVAQFFAQLEKLHLQVMERISPIESRMPGSKPNNGSVQNSNDTNLPVPPAHKTEPKATETEEQNPYLEKAIALAVGQWVELLDDSGTKIRCRLVAILRNSGNRVFVNRSGCKAAELSTKAIAKKLQTQQILLLEDTRLFDKALTSVISNLRSRKKALSI